MGSLSNDRTGRDGMKGEPTEDGARLQWTVKGIDPVVRELSRKAARKMGMRVGSWVEHALRNAAEEELRETKGASASYQAAVVEKLEENTRVMQEIRDDLHLLQRGFIEKIVHGK